MPNRAQKTSFGHVFARLIFPACSKKGQFKFNDVRSILYNLHNFVKPHKGNGDWKTWDAPLSDFFVSV